MQQKLSTKNVPFPFCMPCDSHDVNQITKFFGSCGEFFSSMYTFGFCYMIYILNQQFNTTIVQGHFCMFGFCQTFNGNYDILYANILYIYVNNSIIFWPLFDLIYLNLLITSHIVQMLHSLIPNRFLILQKYVG